MMHPFRMLCCALIVATAAPAFAADCSAFARDSIGKVMDVFHATATPEAQKRASLAKLFQQTVDTDWIGRTVLGRYWRDATPEKQQAYLKLYGQYITANYVSKFNDEDGMSVEAITIASMAPDANGGGYETKTLVKRKGEEDIHVDYLLDDTTSACKVHDIKVEGVSLLISQRSEFSSIAAHGGIDAVIAALQSK